MIIYYNFIKNYKSDYMDEVLRLRSSKTNNDNATFCLYFRIISEFGIIVFIYMIYLLVKKIKECDFKYKIPMVLIISYLYIQFDSYAFYSLWLLLAVIVCSKHKNIKGEKVWKRKYQL